MSESSSWNFLSAHHLLFQVLSLIERSRSYAVLVTAYLDPWPNLELVLRQAVSRGVAVHLVTRSADATCNDTGKRGKAIERMRALGVHLHEVDWLHTKLYLSESEAIVSSFNLTSGGHDSPNLGVHLHGERAAMQALLQIDQWIPGFSEAIAPPPGPPSEADAPAFCIRCRGPRSLLNPTKPYCAECWQARKAEQQPPVEACCHRCGHPASTTLRAPFCAACSTHARMRRLSVV